MIMIGLFLTVGCKKDPVAPGGGTPTGGGGGEEPDYPIEIPFEECSLAETCQWTNLAYNNTVIVINSGVELRQYVACTGSGYPEIDFETQTLLLASGKAEKGISEIIVNSLQQLSANEYELNVEIDVFDNTNASTWSTVLIAEKVSEESHVELNVTCKKEKPIVITLGKTWVLIEKEINGEKEMLPEEPYPITLTFFSDTTFRGRHDANFYGGKYNLRLDTISLNLTELTDVWTGYWFWNYVPKLSFIDKISLTDSTMQFSSSDNSLMFNYISKEKFEKDYFELEKWYNF